MLTKKENERLTRVGPGTPAGAMGMRIQGFKPSVAGGALQGM